MQGVMYYASPALASVALGIGLALTGTDVWSNMEYQLSVEGGITALVVAVPVASAAALTALPVARMAWRARRRFEALLCAITLVVATAFSLYATFDRTSSVRDAKRAALVARNQGPAQAEAALKAAEARLAKKEAEILAERKDGGCGRECRRLKGDLPGLQAAIDTARQAVATAGPVIATDSAGDRIAHLTAGLVSARTVDLLQPMLLPLLMFLGGLAFFGAGVAEVQAWRSERRASAPAATPAALEAPRPVVVAANDDPEPPAMSDDEIIDWIVSFAQREGRNPMIKEVQEGTRRWDGSMMPTSTVHRRIKFAEQNYLRVVA